VTVTKARLESFSDGVFAFAITVLVLGVQVPELKTGSDSELRTALLRALSQLIPYVTSFATIGIIWLNHHAMFHSVERVEHTTLTLNLLLLLVVAPMMAPAAAPMAASRWVCFTTTSPPDDDDTVPELVPLVPVLVLPLDEPELRRRVVVVVRRTGALDAVRVGPAVSALARSAAVNVSSFGCCC